MTTRTTPDFWDACRRFFTLKPESRVLAEEEQSRHRPAFGSQTSGIFGFIDQKKQEVAELEKATRIFLTDINDHFGDYASYLKPEFNGKSKFEHLPNTTHKRRFAIKWTAHEVEADFRIEIAFVLTELPGEGAVRADYIFRHGAKNKEVINDDLSMFKETYKDEEQFLENFRRVEKFENEDAFVQSGLPQWFKDMLDQYVYAQR